MLCLDEPSLPIETRLRCVRACESLFRKLLLPRCSPHLSHCDWHGAAPLNSICYMWWDLMPVFGGPEPEDRRSLHAAALEPDLFASVTLRGTPESWSTVVGQKAPAGLLTSTVHGALRAYDLPDLVRLIDQDKVRIEPSKE